MLKIVVVYKNKYVYILYLNSFIVAMNHSSIFCI